jgi:hypothetical protein
VIGESQADSPYLSVVAASRNDDHGGDPLVRTQIFINMFARQCEKYRMPAELILVDWNPVPGRPGLAAVLTVPPETTFVRGRVITVPTALHQRLKYADKLRFFQMIAKNVGIRRARGEFILATNVDILLSDELISFIGHRCLDRGKVYRVDRCDIRNGMPGDVLLDEALEYAWNNAIRSHTRYQPLELVRHLYGSGESFKRSCVPDPEFRGAIDDVTVVHEHGVWEIRPDRSARMSHLHTNGCGDFMLLSREGWDAIRGYPEFEAFSFNIDSMGLIAAHHGGYEEVSLLPPCVCFHIEHEFGSGWTPEGERTLFKRLRTSGILNPEWPVLMPLAEEMRTNRRNLEFNHARWGMVDFDLPEQGLGETASIPVETLARLDEQAATYRASAIQPAYDLDRLALAYERDAMDMLRATVAADAESVVIFIPGEDGSYGPDRAMVYRAHLERTRTLTFRLERFPSRWPLRLDPCQCKALVTINSLTAFDATHNRVIWELDGRDAARIGIGGTAEWVRASPAGSSGRMKFFGGNDSNGHQPLRLVSTGRDPQLMLPPLPADTEFPLIVSVEMKIIPID